MDDLDFKSFFSTLDLCRYFSEQALKSIDSGDPYSAQDHATRAASFADFLLDKLQRPPQPIKPLWTQEWPVFLNPPQPGFPDPEDGTLAHIGCKCHRCVPGGL